MAMAPSRQPLLLLLCFCAALAVAPAVSTAAESYLLMWEFSDTTFPLNADLCIPCILLNTTDCDPLTTACPPVSGIDVTVTAAGGDVAVRASNGYCNEPQNTKAGDTSAGSAAGSARPRAPPAETPINGRKSPRGTQADPLPHQHVGNAKPGNAKPGKAGVKSSCQGCPLTVKTPNNGRFYIVADSSSEGQTAFTASAEVGGQTVTTGELKVKWSNANYQITWPPGIDGFNVTDGILLLGQIRDLNNCAAGECAGPAGVQVTVFATGAEVTLTPYAGPGQGAEGIGKGPHLLPGNPSDSHTPGPVPGSTVPVTAKHTHGQPQQTPSQPQQTPGLHVSHPLPAGVQQPKKLAPKQACASQPGCTVDVQTYQDGNFGVVVTRGDSNRGGITQMLASAVFEGQRLTTYPFTLTWVTTTDFSTITLAPIKQKLSLGSKAKLTATVTNSDGTPVPGITVSFKVTLVLNGVLQQSVDATSSSRTAPVADAASSSIKATTAAATAAAMRLTKQATSDVNGHAVLRLTNPKYDTPGSYKVIAYAINNQDDFVKSNPVLVTWREHHGYPGDYGYDGDNEHYGDYGSGNIHTSTLGTMALGSTVNTGEAVSKHVKHFAVSGCAASQPQAGTQTAQSCTCSTNYNSWSIHDTMIVLRPKNAKVCTVHSLWPGHF
jgi:hypothetical protein